MKAAIWRCLNLVLFLLVTCYPAATLTAATARENDNSGKLIEYLAQEKNSLTLAINEIKQPVTPVNQADYQRLIEQNEARVALNNAKIASFESFLVNQKKIQVDFSLRIKQLQQFPSTTSHQISAQEKIERITSLNEINKKTIELINTNLDLAHRYQSLLKDQRQSLDLWQSKLQLQEQLSGFHNQEAKLNESLRKLYEASIRLQQEIKTGNGFNSNYLLEAKLLLNNQIITLTQHKIAELNLQRKLAKADYLLLKAPDIRTLQTVTDDYKEVINQLSDMEQSLKKMISVLKNEQPHISDPNLKQQFISLTRIINSRIAGIGIQEQTLQEDLENHQQELKKQLSVRQSLSEYRVDIWPVIFTQLTQIPAQFYTYLKSLAMKIRDNYLWQDRLSALFIWGSFLLAGIVLYSLNRLLNRVTQDKERQRLSAHLYDGLLSLLSRNMPGITLAVGLFVLFYVNQIPFANYSLLANLIFVWLSFRTLLLVARIGLMERLSDSSGQDVRLYYRIKWLLLIGGWITAFMVFSHQLPLSLLLQDIFNRLFMMFLLSVAIVVWKSNDVIVHILHPLLKLKKRYVRNAVMLLVRLAPMTLFLTAVIGLAGYINLAWTMSNYLVQILLIISAYVLIRGLLLDLLDLLSEWMISKLTNGWIWIEIILKPLDKILRLFLVVFAIFILFQLFDWHSESSAVVKLKQLSQYVIINISGVHITVESVIEFLLLSSFFIWASKWTREFCFRWLYRNTNDAGIRNSLSVFTQYAVILLGGFIALRVLGLDFSGMSMVIGGLAVGMGFGLRDFASNIVGGLMLLIERPVREGDLITLGEYEGKVAHIGIRSMRVSSWDNMEVLIPNAETFNKPFTNWTHQDSIIRTVIPVKVSRSDDPLMIQQLILDVLAIIPEILPEPPSQVFLKQIDDALIEFEVRYFINIETHTRFEIRSKVLFAIMAQFKAAGVKAPVPPISVELKEGKHETAFAHFSTQE